MSNGTVDCKYAQWDSRLHELCPDLLVTFTSFFYTEGLYNIIRRILYWNTKDQNKTFP